MTMDQKQHSKTLRKALRLIHGGYKTADTCRRNIGDAWLAIIDAHSTANDNVIRT